MRDPYICCRVKCRYHGGRTDGGAPSCNYFFCTGVTKTSLGEADVAKKCGLYDTTPLKRTAPKPFIVSAVSPPERKGRKYNWKEFRALWDEGKTDGEIAKEMRCSKDTVANWRHAEGLDFRRRRAPITRSELLEDWKAGMNDPKIAAKHGVSPMTVNRLRREMGLEARGGKK